MRSSTRVTISLWPCSSLIRSTGSIAVRSLKWGSRGAPSDGLPVDRLHPLDEALLAAHLGLRGEVLALPEPELLHQVLGELGVVGRGEEVALELPQEGVRALGLGVEHALHRDEVGRGLRLAAAEGAPAGPGLLRRARLLLLACLPVTAAPAG